MVLFYRYSFFAITIVSDAIICSAAAWNFPVAKNADLPAQLRIDTYMIFLGAFSLLVVTPALFVDMFSQLFITGRVWVECLWVDFLWLLHLVSAIVVTTTLPWGMCTPQAQRIDGSSCTSTKLIMAFSWICTINLFIYLAFLVISAVLHQKQDDSVWNAQVRSYPWYHHFYCHKLGSSPEIPPRDHLQVPIAAPQPRRLIHLHTQSMLSSHSVERIHDQLSGITKPHVLPPTMQEARQGPMALYPLHIQAVLEPAIEPSSGRENFSPGFACSLPDGSNPPPLCDWPRADIMSQPLPGRTVARKVPASSLPSAVGPPRGQEGGLPWSLPSTSTQAAPDWHGPGRV